MTYDNLSDSSKIKFVEMMNNGATNLEVAKQFGIGQRTVSLWKKKLLEEGFEINRPKLNRYNTNRDVEPDINNPLMKDNFLLKEENKNLKKALNSAKEEISISEQIKKIFYDLNSFEYNEKEIPDFNSMHKKVNGVPVLMLSDLHYGEKVSPKEVNYVNEYNSEIAEARINFTVDSAIKIIKNDWTAYDFEWFVLPLGGDSISGVIHDELTESNDIRILPSIFKLADILIYQIEKIASEFGKVYIPCVVGNHGRIHKKPRAKGAVEENYEYALYKLIEKHYNDDDNVIVHVSESPDLRFDIFNKRFLLTHGNTLGGGGNGIAGILPLLYRGNYKKQERATSVNDSYDILLIGHFHQSLFLNKVFVNGCTKGIDEYALNQLNIPYEPPSQNLFVVDRNFGEITYRLPVMCEPPLDINVNKNKTITVYE